MRLLEVLPWPVQLLSVCHGQSNVRARSRVLQVGIGKKHKTPQQRNAAIGFGNGLVKLVQGVGEGAYDFVSLPGM
jgi:hypothetical protein